MPAVYPFRAIQYRRGAGDVSDLVAPPYDVLDAEAKRELLARNPGNIVGVDLPCVPASRKGPQEAYDAAAKTYQDLLAQGTLTQRETPAMFAYRQTFEYAGKRRQRIGLACTLDTVPFGPREGGGVLAHEQTFGGPKEDRLALMHATRCQISPVFGLYADKDGAGAALARRITDARAPDMVASTGDGVAQEVWTIDDPGDIGAIQDALAGEDVFIADGHHRYNTALNYLHQLNEDGSLPLDHPARRSMFILVSMNEPGLIVGPTHRVLGGMADYTIEKFIDAAAGTLNTEPIDNNPHTIEKQLDRIADREDTNAFGLYDYATGLCFAGWPAVSDPLSDNFPDKPDAWRGLDVALVQHLIVEEICQPLLNDNKPVKWAFPHTIDEMLAIGRGDMTSSSVEESGKAQLAVIVRPTPLDAVREICLAGELMPQKSTFFYPKLITGLFLSPLS